LLLISTACGGGDPSSGSVEAGLIERCAGVATCQLAGQPDARGELQRVGDECRLDDAFTLAPMGAVYEAGTTTDTGITWTGNAEHFQLCGDAACTDCTVAPLPGSEVESNGNCQGTPRSCSSLSAGSCVLDGCSFAQHVKWDGSIEYECEGTAKRCNSYSTAAGCAGQSGCSWR
jgi:hypothetical protein